MTEILVFDKEGVLDRLEGDLDLLRELYAIFCSNRQKESEMLQQAVAENNLSQIGAKAHSFKGALGNIGAMRAHQIAYALEKAAKEGKMNEISPLHSALLVEIDRYLEAFAQQA